MEIKPQDIKDYIHMYIGCEALHSHGHTFEITHDDISYCVTWPSMYKLILRKLSDMTEEDRLKYGWTIEETDEGLKVNYPFESFRLLCKDGWDLFGLIPAGLAIDKTSLKN